jgi:2,4'-dihydroxyacetophenone dioxygenase
VVGPGGCVYDPVGNVDSWKAVGGEPAVVHIVSCGAMEYLGGDDQILRRDTPASLRDIYLRYCREHGIEALDLG